jgi:preprotein translocase subunit SecF
MLALLCLLLLGPAVIFGLTIAIFLGIFVGTYSSIYISSPILVWLRVSGASFLPKTNVGPGGAERVTSRNEGV